ncbi:hypothetical protein PIB30_088973, partial [Stylosanthes scabra]|nr:hypothetical protein [Stylosanthes scabra]
APKNYFQGFYQIWLPEDVLEDPHEKDLSPNRPTKLPQPLRQDKTRRTRKGCTRRTRRTNTFDALDGRWKAPKHLAELATLMIQKITLVIRTNLQIHRRVIPEILQDRHKPRKDGI